MKKRLCITKAGRITPCSCPVGKMGRGRCNHVGEYNPQEYQNSEIDKDESVGELAEKKINQTQEKEDSHYYAIFEKSAYMQHKLAETSNDFTELAILTYQDNKKTSELAKERLKGVIKDLGLSEEESNLAEARVLKHFIWLV